MQGAANFLGNPLTQAALSGYFNAIGTPRLQGRGGMIANAGLGALGGYNAAEQRQANAPLTAAKIAGMQNQNQLTSAQAGLTQQKTQQLAGIGSANAALAAQIHAAIPTMTPAQAQRATLLANTIATDTSKVYDPKDAFDAIYQEPLKEAQIQAQTSAATAAGKKSTAETAAIPSEEALREAETARANAEAAHAGEAGSSGVAEWQDMATGEQYKGVQRNPNDKLVSTLKEPKATDPMVELTRLQTMYSAQHPYASRVGGGMSFEEFAVSKGYDPASGQKLPPAPAGGGYKFDPTTGQIMATDSSGTPTHIWVPD